MSLPYDSDDFTKPRANGQSWVEYPFLTDDDTTTKIYHLQCEVNEADYVPIALDTTMASAANADVHALPFTADATAYHIGDYNHQVRDGVIRSFDRRFAKIPIDRDDIFTGTVAYPYPGIAATSTDGTERTITAASNAVVSGVNYTTLTCTNTAVIGEVIYVALTTTTGGSTFAVNNYYRVLTGTTGSAIKIQAVPVGTTFGAGTVTELTIQPTGQKTIPTGSNSDFSYYLPGVTVGITVPADVTETATFTATSGFTGEAVSTLSETTIPTSAEYAAMIDDGDYIVAESNVDKWFGNIIQKQDVKVRAL